MYVPEHEYIRVCLCPRKTRATVSLTGRSGSVSAGHAQYPEHHLKLVRAQYRPPTVKQPLTCGNAGFRGVSFGSRVHYVSTSSRSEASGGQPPEGWFEGTSRECRWVARDSADG